MKIWDNANFIPSRNSNYKTKIQKKEIFRLSSALWFGMLYKPIDNWVDVGRVLAWYHEAANFSVRNWLESPAMNIPCYEKSFKESSSERFCFVLLIKWIKWNDLHFFGQSLFWQSSWFVNLVAEHQKRDAVKWGFAEKIMKLTFWDAQVFRISSIHHITTKGNQVRFKQTESSA